MTKKQKLVLLIMFIILIIFIILNVIVMNKEEKIIEPVEVNVGLNNFIDNYNEIDNLNNYELENRDNVKIYHLSDYELLVIKYDNNIVTNVIYQVDKDSYLIDNLNEHFTNIISSTKLDYSDKEIDNIISKLSEAIEYEPDDLGTLLQVYENEQYYLVSDKDSVYQYHLFLK